MAAATMLDSGHRAFFDAKVEFLLKVATLLPTLLTVGVI